LLLDKVFFKILSSETDFDFEENLNTFLPKLILKLATSDEVVRRKVMEILVHINKRIKSRPEVQLPLDDLLKMFNESSDANLSFVTNFSLIYIKLSFPRLSKENKAIYVEKLLNCLENKSPSHQDS
jgi:proteasome component ECM29